ncbi:MAG TPA: class I lanthipeptide [Kofleriaceae bacterium]|jgi:hypothetical protein|nr:class I lanthipeptide [Kofleriaceae bacterium]
MNKNKNKHRRLELKKETVIYLTDDLLKHVIGGSTEPEPTQSLPISKCCSIQ